MIRLLLEPVNLLILDEPTNHLDMISKDVLKEAIRAFDGTVIVVSHDREFLDGLVEKVYEFDNGKVKEHLGGIYDYLRDKNAETINEALNKKNEVKSEDTTTSYKSNEQKTESKQTYEQRKADQKRQNKIEKRRKTLENEIEAIETRKNELDKLLMKPENATNMQMVTEYTELQQQLEKLEEEYFSL